MPKNLLKLRTSGKHKNKHHEKQKDRQGRLDIKIQMKKTIRITDQSTNFQIVTLHKN